MNLTFAVIILTQLSFIGCLHDPANVQHYICWKFAKRLLDRVNTPLGALRTLLSFRFSLCLMQEH